VDRRFRCNGAFDSWARHPTSAPWKIVQLTAVRKGSTMSNASAPGLSRRTIDLDRVNVGDITYIRTWEGWLYLATVSTTRHDALSGGR
jgi:hypothetical protein